MRRRANRAAIFAVVLGAHLLALHFLPDFHPPQEISDRELSLSITFVPTQSKKPLTAISRARHPASERQRATASSGRARPAARGRKRENASPAPLNSAGAHPWIDWDKQADAVVADRAEREAEAARRASALSRWREHVMPAPWTSHGPQFRWDYAATHRFQSTPGGLVINITDRCFIVTTGLFVLPVCRIGETPAYGDLFAHMDDPKRPEDSIVP